MGGFSCLPLYFYNKIAHFLYHKRIEYILGENIVRGDKESIRNLLEIFDGLLEYLHQEINADSQNSGKQRLFSSLLSFSPHFSCHQ